jgi:hypothetical protein
VDAVVPKGLNLILSPSWMKMTHNENKGLWVVRGRMEHIYVPERVRNN